MIAEIWSRTKYLFLGKRRREVDEEIQFHLEREAQENMARGMTPEEARRRAAIAFGGKERAREQAHEQRPIWTLESLVRDLRYGARGLARNPMFTAVAVLTLALAIGANTTIFSLLDQALMQSLPVKDPGQLVVLSFAGDVSGHTEGHGGDSPGHRHSFSYPMYKDLRDRNTVFSGVIGAAPIAVGVTWNNRAETASAEMVSGNYFDVLGVPAAMGRLFVSGDETAPGANPVAVLNFDYWKSHLAEAQVVGQIILINGTPFTILGVSAPGFHSMVWGELPEVYVPLTMQKTVQPEWDFLSDHKSYFMNIVARLKPGVSPTQATAAMNTLFRDLRTDEFPLLNDQSAKERDGFITRAHLNLEAGAQGFSPLRDSVQTPLKIIMGMVLLVILMAIVNVASLLLVRAATRAREFSVRFALGATSGQVLRQLLAEGILLGVAGAAVGLALAPEALRLLIRWMSMGDTSNQHAFSPTMDWRVLLFTVAATLVASLLFSLAPAAQFWNPKLAESLRQGRSEVGGSLRFRRTCVALQIGFSLFLIVGAGLFVRTIGNLRNVNAGFETDHLLSFELDPALAGDPATSVAPVEQRALDAIAALPGVRGAGATNDEDLAGDGVDGDVQVSGYTPPPNEDYTVELPWVSDGYMQALGIQLLAGRYFNAGDTATSTKVAIVNESFAKHFFGSTGAAPGHHITRPHRPKSDSLIVGVVRDVKHTSVRDPIMPTSYTLFAQESRAVGLIFYVRTWQDPGTTANSIRAAIANIDSKLIVAHLHTMRATIDDSISTERTTALLATAFGVLATILAGIGLYGILAYSTAQRTREIGIRMALGARRTTVVRLILWEVMALAGGAMLVTIPIAILATRAVRSQLFGVSIADPAVYGVGIAIICLVAGLAGFVPARRAATVDPARALRTD